MLLFSYNLLLLAFLRVFPVLWKIAKIFVDPKTRAKCVVLKNSELHKLCDYFDPEDLPEEFGGTCRCVSGCLPPVPKHMVSLTFRKKFHFPSDEHGGWYNFIKSFCMQAQSKTSGAAIDDISELVEVWIQAKQFLLCKTLGQNIAFTCCLCIAQFFLDRPTLPGLIPVSETQSSFLVSFTSKAS